MSSWLAERRKNKPDTAFSWAWIAWGLAFLVLEGWALIRKKEGDTLTENLKYLMAHYGWVSGAVGVLLAWLIYHFMFQS